MLTQNDLKKIGQIVNNSIDTRVPPLINHAIQTQVPPLISHAIQTQVPPLINHAIRTQTPSLIKRELDPIKKSLDKLQKDTKYIINALDRELMHTIKRTDRIERNLGLPPLPETPIISQS